MNFLTQLRRYRWIITGRWKIKRLIESDAKKAKLKIILGSGGTNYEGWIASDLPHFNILNEKDWKYFFSKRKIDNLLAEHVLEHLTEKEVQKVFQFAYQYLNTSGIFRIAVPDAYNPNPEYIKMVKPPQDGHKTFWNYQSLSLPGQKNNFSILLLEYFDEHGGGHQLPFTNKDGHISRRGSNIAPEYLKNYSSLIIDFIKQ